MRNVRRWDAGYRRLQKMTQSGHSLLNELVTRPLLLLMLAHAFSASRPVGD
jgi:hypothetical protein